MKPAARAAPSSAETCALLRRQAECCVRRAQAGEAPALAGELLTLAACLHERAADVNGATDSEAEQAILRMLV